MTFRFRDVLRWQIYWYVSRWLLCVLFIIGLPLIFGLVMSLLALVMGLVSLLIV